MGDTSEKRRGCGSAGNEVAAQGLFAAPLRPVLSRCVLRALWGGRVAASAHIMEGHKGPCDTLPRAIQSAVPIARRVTKGPVAHCHVPVPWGLPHPSKPAPQRHSAEGAPEVPAKEAPRTPQESSQPHTGRKQRVVRGRESTCGHLQGQVLQGSPQLCALPTSFVGSSNASAEEPKGNGVSGHFSYHTARLGNCC